MFFCLFFFYQVFIGYKRRRGGGGGGGGGGGAGGLLVLYKYEIWNSFTITRLTICPFEHTQNNRQINFLFMYGRVSVRAYSFCWNFLKHLALFRDTGHKFTHGSSAHFS